MRADGWLRCLGSNVPSAYALESSVPEAPQLTGESVTAASSDELIDRIASDLVTHAANCVRRFGDFHLALSGGENLDPLYCRLMYDPNYRVLPWRRTHLWLVNERCVPEADPRCRFRQISETIVDHADIPPDQVHPIVVDSQAADSAYEASLKETLAWREKGHDRLDYVLLSADEDGPITGRLDGRGSESDDQRLVRFVEGEMSNPDLGHVAMTLELINAARFVAVVVTGRGGAVVVRRMVEGRESPDTLPLMGVAPLNGELKWYLDAEACEGAVA